ncbi:metallophosphoesterase family protein [Mycobacterium sp. KBS0706]|uniref:metallophosphoesterase family protein n=1 Tax=Mycobacterium sp. KBS0706 TaxID=2578109 RepID=UPI00110FAE2E|nr:metallophosphoesterase family protein [Mycobacterium sp. KBS0706]TSD84704.1 metallophosphoesterase family protein [Mycobacterium sp. KBS0706]
MRLAVLADIHGNLPALEAVLADLGRRGADGIVHLGDCVSGPLWPRETLDLLVAKGWPTVRGNHDRWVWEDRDEPLTTSDGYARHALDAAGRAWLGALPMQLELPGGITAFHARPDDDNAYLLEDIEAGRLVRAPADAIAARLAGVSARVVLCGHSHLPWLLRLPDGRWILNPGSIGAPAYDDPTPPAHVSESGSPAARYAMLELDGDKVAAELIAIPYDHDRAVRRAAENGRPDWAHQLATGFSRPSGS